MSGLLVRHCCTDEESRTASYRKTKTPGRYGQWDLIEGHLFKLVYIVDHTNICSFMVNLARRYQCIIHTSSKVVVLSTRACGIHDNDDDDKLLV